MRVAIVAGESSGDILGAGLIHSLKKLDSTIEFVGIGGPKMIAEGFDSFFPMERLSVMGIVEPLKRLPELLHIRKTIKSYCLGNDIDLFIGIDSPDFNLPIERFLKDHGKKTVHYVSPSVWAWRQGRIEKIKRSVDLMLTLLPFEAGFYKEHHVPVQFVGHPLADDIAMQPDTEQARKALGVSDGKKVIALMPGSRGGEVKLLGLLFLQVAAVIQQRLGDCTFIIPAANAERKAQLESQLQELGEDFLEANHIKLVDGQSHQVMEAADAVLLASGTTALEAMLLKKPMVVSYKMAPFSYAIISRLLKSKYISLPNLLAGKSLVPEILQDDATVERLTNELEKALTNNNYRKNQVDAFYELHESIQCNASTTAANAVMGLLK